MTQENHYSNELLERINWMLGDEQDGSAILTEDQWARPHVFIGLGGVGTRTVTRIAQRVSAMIAEAGEEGALPSCLQFVAIDTDPIQLSAEVTRAGVRTVDMTVSAPVISFNDNREVFGQHGYDVPLRVETGTGGKRNVSKFAFLANSETIRDVLDTAIGNAGRYEGIVGDRNPRIHVFASLGGGTGCGSILDLAFLIRDLTAEDATARVEGYIVLPIENMVSATTMASAGCAMKELEYFMQLGQATFAGWGEAPRPGETIPYWRNGTVRGLVRRPFDFCYLFGASGVGQGTVKNPSQFPGVLAEACIRNAFSDAGATNAQLAVNVNDYFDNHSNGKYHCFSAIGFSRLTLPTADIAARLILALAARACDFLLDGVNSLDKHSPQSKAVIDIHTTRLGAGLTTAQLVPANMQPLLDVAASALSLQKLRDEGNVARIKQACDGFVNLPETIWEATTAKREEAIEQRKQELRQAAIGQIEDLNYGIKDDIEFFLLLKERLNERLAQETRKEDSGRKAFEKYKTLVPAASKFLNSKSLMDRYVFFTRRFTELKGVYQAGIMSLREYLLARANAELIAGLIEELDAELTSLVQLRDTIARDLRARYKSRETYFLDRLEGMKHGKASDDCKTFCPIDLKKMEDDAEKILTGRSTRFGGLISHEITNRRFSLVELATGSKVAVQNARVAILAMLAPEFPEDQLWQHLFPDAQQWEQSLEEQRQIVLNAANPLLKFSAAPHAAVIGCYSNFTDHDLGTYNAAPADIGMHRKTDSSPLYAGSNSSEATRFFHGIGLIYLSVSSDMGRYYRAYMRELQQNSSGAQHSQDYINIFPSLLGWTAPDEGAPQSQVNESLKLWTLGLCFAEIFPAGVEQRQALNASNKLLGTSGQKRDRKNFLFSIGNNYYLQPYYDPESSSHAPHFVKLGNGREKAQLIFESDAKWLAEMRKWYEYAENRHTEVFSTPELKAEILKYIETLTGTRPLIAQERTVLHSFMDEPFREN